VKIVVHGDTVNVSEIRELGTATANSFQSALSAALSSSVKHIDLDLSQTTFVDCGGLGALVAIWKRTSNGQGAATIRLLNAPETLQRIVSMMKMGDFFPMATGDIPAAKASSVLHN
jgi:anti-anti-sigma factor